MKRRRPDPLQFAIWAAAHLRFETAREWRARGLWLHWRDFAQARNAEPGSPRSFSNALRKIGCPDQRGRLADTPKARTHAGIGLDLSGHYNGSVDGIAWAWSRYSDGYDWAEDEYRVNQADQWRAIEERMAAAETRLEQRLGKARVA